MTSIRQAWVMFAAAALQGMEAATHCGEHNGGREWLTRGPFYKHGGGRSGLSSWLGVAGTFRAGDAERNAKGEPVILLTAEQVAAMQATERVRDAATLADALCAELLARDARFEAFRATPFKEGVPEGLPGRPETGEVTVTPEDWYGPREEPEEL